LPYIQDLFAQPFVPEVGFGRFVALQLRPQFLHFRLEFQHVSSHAFERMRRIFQRSQHMGAKAGQCAVGTSAWCHFAQDRQRIAQSFQQAHIEHRRIEQRQQTGAKRQ
jgi:hypothetical protein